MRMKAAASFVIFVCSFVLVGVADDVPDTSPMAELGAGTRIVVGIKAVVIPAHNDTVYFQNGVLLGWSQVDKEQPSCRLYVPPRDVARQLNPGRALTVTTTRFNNSENPTFYGDSLVFGGDATVDQLQCASATKRPTTVAQLRMAIGNLFSLIQAAPIPS